MSKRVALLPLGVFCVFAALVACGDSDGKASDIAKMLSSSSEAIETFSSSDSELSSSSLSTEMLSSSGKAPSKVKIKYGFMKNRCDGKKYKTMTIGNQTWMAQNFNFQTPYSECFGDDKRSCAKYGRRYDWEEAMEICPAGWHLPTMSEWERLISLLGGNEVAGKFFKKASGWGNSSEVFRFWSSTECYGKNEGYGCPTAESFILDGSELYYAKQYKSELKSVRCVRDERREIKDERREENGNKGVEKSLKVKTSGKNATVRKHRRIMGVMTDPRNGKSYKTVKIGKQTWMAQNLNYKMDDSFCYDNRAVNCAKYGSLYEWADAMNACPAGWHLPTKAEWDTLISNAGGALLAGKMLKSKRGWKSLKGKNFGNGTDAFGFSALPAGYFSRGFENKDYKAYFWSSSKAPSYYENLFFYLKLGGDYDNEKYERQKRYFNRCDLKIEHDYSLPEDYERAVWSDMNHDNRLSVRCVKDDVEQTHGTSVLQASDVVRQARHPRRENDAGAISSSSEALFVASFVPPSDVVKGTFKDKRDGRKYRTVTIGNQTWIAENLKFKSAKSSCYENADSNCVKFGRLYPWNEAVDACPAGWRLPMKADWDTLIASVGGEKIAGKMLRAMGDWGGMGVVGAFFNCVALGGGRAYYASDNGSDDYGFSVIPAGRSEEVTFWSSTEYSSYEAYILNLSGMNAHAKIDANYKTENFSVRCLKNNVKKVSPSSLVRDSITDARDGQTYKTVAIGVQTWMAQNLNYKTDSSYCYGDSVENCAKYGRLYTWKAAKDACPAGFHLPTQLEWDNLFLMAGGPSSAGDALRSKSGWMPTRWWQISDNGSDDYGFSALPAGYFESTYTDKGDKAYFWSSSVGSIEHYRDRNCGRHYRELPYSSWNHGRSVWLRGSAVHWTYSEEYKNQAYSIRCVKDMEKIVIPDTALNVSQAVLGLDSSSFLATSFSTGGRDSMHSETKVSSKAIGSITDSRDGQSYKTVKIGKQTWMAENLNYKTEKSYCYGFDSTKCLKYGRLYSWEGAKDACPTGWHVPKLTDWMTLFFTVKDTLSVGRVLRSSSDWKDLRGNEYGNGTDDYGFSALPGGYINGSARDLGHKAYFWGYTNDGKTYSIKFGGAYDDLGCELQKEKEEKNRYPTSKLLQWHRYDSSHDIDVLKNEDLCLPKNYNSVVWEYISEDANLSVRCVKDEISRK